MGYATFVQCTACATGVFQQYLVAWNCVHKSLYPSKDMEWNKSIIKRFFLDGVGIHIFLFLLCNSINEEGRPLGGGEFGVLNEEKDLAPPPGVIWETANARRWKWGGSVRRGHLEGTESGRDGIEHKTDQITKGLIGPCDIWHGLCAWQKDIPPAHRSSYQWSKTQRHPTFSTGTKKKKN
jgi:hypothetical protein